MFGLEDELHDGEQEIATLKAELQRFREREPLVQELLQALPFDRNRPSVAAAIAQNIRDFKVNAVNDQDLKSIFDMHLEMMQATAQAMGVLAGRLESLEKRLGDVERKAEDAHRLARGTVDNGFGR